MYNFKVIQYPNGTCQIRYYSEMMGKEEYQEEKTKEIEFETEPFSGTKARVVNDFGNPEENQRKSLAHTRSMIHTYARCCRWEWFCTFTYDGKKVDRYDFKLCMKKIRNWLKNQRRLAPDLKYLAVPEMHKDGAWHLHVLLADSGTMKFVDSGKKYLGMKIYNLSGWKWGFSTATEIQDTFRIQNYISKYMTKDCFALSQNCHRYYASRNLPKPMVKHLLINSNDVDEVIQNLLDSLGMEIQHTKTIHSDFTDVTYIELS